MRKNENKAMRILVLGLRGIPGIQGGIESHVENLCPLLVEKGCDVEVIVRSPYHQGELRKTVWQGVSLTSLWSPRKSAIETAVHTFLGVIYAAVKRPDVLHIHAVGPALMTPLARLLGLRVVVTHHSTDYHREKWGPFARWLLQSGEWAGARFANRCIAVSAFIKDLVKAKYDCDCALIPNGVVLHEPAYSHNALQKFSLEAGRYVLYVGRLDPGKRQSDLIRAFQLAETSDWKLVLVGGIDPDDRYTREILSLSQNSENIVLTDFQTGTALRELYTQAGLFVLPSAHEGHPIALLEALSYGIPVLASDIPMNREIGLTEEQYFPVGNIQALATRIRSGTQKSGCYKWPDMRETIKQRYDWNNIAEKTLLVYRSVI